MNDNRQKTFWQTVKCTISGRCPNCCTGKLFKSYLKPVAECTVCHEPLGHIRADDGPAWLTILIVGHILAIFLLAYSPDLGWSIQHILMVAMPLLIISILLILPCAKGFFIGMIWYSGCVGSEK